MLLCQPKLEPASRGDQMCSYSNPDSKHICLAVHLLNEHYATVRPTVYVLYFLF